ncbi:MAG: UDP-N-acetylmuramate:L-alanyl-gamma-D-glutamyl-meso-diaminopimelate ligase [Marinicellaceae bacterium]
MNAHKKQKIHILGICGTFMGGLAELARSLGYAVSGSDKNVYPPMSTQLESIGIGMHQGYDDSVLNQYYDEVVVGNVMTRGMPVIETLLSSERYFSSGPQWLGDHLLRHKKVFAVAGTHGKTTTSSMLAWILEDNNNDPGFLIGGVAEDFGISARNTDSESFVIEADEYDSAFFDKRSKFVHYHANVAILNNLEYDHADIFPNLDAIKTQFHHFIRTIPNNGSIIFNNNDENLKEVLSMGCWTPLMSFGTDESADIYAKPTKADYSEFSVIYGEHNASIQWSLTGKHNMLNAVAAIAAAYQQGVGLNNSALSLENFKGIKRRMEFIGEVNGVKIFDDFAHHPTAIATTIDGIKKQIGDQQLIAIFEPRSNSMRAGAHAKDLPSSLLQADVAIVMDYPELNWEKGITEKLDSHNIKTISSVASLIEALKAICESKCHVVFMSNGSFDNAPRRFLEALKC